MATTLSTPTPTLFPDQVIAAVKSEVQSAPATPAAPATDQAMPKKKAPKSVADSHSIFDIDEELDALFDRMQEELETAGQISPESQDRFNQFASAYGEKIDRIARFTRVQEAVADFAKKEAERLRTRANSAENKVKQTKNLLLFFMAAKGTAKLEGQSYTVRAQNNSQDSVRVLDINLVPMKCKRISATIDGPLWDIIVNSVPAEVRPLLAAAIQDTSVISDAVKSAVQRGEEIAGAQVFRGKHVRIA